MKQPLYAILIAPDQKVRNAILDGVKKITIREGHRDYKKGKVMLCCHLAPWAVMAEIVKVRHCTLRGVTKEECVADGFSNRVELLRGLQIFYTDITLDSSVTVIRWDSVEGLLKDMRWR